MLTRFKILYIGSDFLGSNGTSWRDAFEEMGHEVRTLNSGKFMPAPVSFIGKASQKLTGRPPAHLIRELNQAIVCVAQEFRPEVTFYAQAHFVLPETLGVTAKYGPNVACFNDDMFNPKNQTFTFLDGLELLDCIFTTKSYNVEEFHTAGAPLALYIPNAYDPKVHFLAKPTPEELSCYDGDIAFIGTFRPERADFLAALADALQDRRLKVWGGGWHKMDRLTYFLSRRRWGRLRNCINVRELWGADMGKAITSNKICLGLLNHANRDLQTARSFEIPACGGFMLAERTEEHRFFFEEDKEAVYFSSFEEMLEKMRYYLAHDEERKRIADAGYQRCLRSPYKYVDRAQFAIEQVRRLRPNVLST